MGNLTTHVLDSSHGSPAAGIRIDLYSVGLGEVFDLIGEYVTNDDGRCDRPLLDGDAFTPGVYELRFHIGEFFAKTTLNFPDPLFLDVVPIRFGISAPDEHYHVPLLVSPYAYSTYRGS